MTVNTSTLTQRGYRCNLCEFVKSKTIANKLYLTAHNGNAFDFDVKGMSAEEARNKIKSNASLLPFPIRMEKGTTWVHVDVRPVIDSKCKIYEFTA